MTSIFIMKEKELDEIEKEVYRLIDINNALDLKNSLEKELYNQNLEMLKSYSLQLEKLKIHKPKLSVVWGHRGPLRQTNSPIEGE